MSCRRTRLPVHDIRSTYVPSDASTVGANGGGDLLRSQAPEAVEAARAGGEPLCKPTRLARQPSAHDPYVRRQPPERAIRRRAEQQNGPRSGRTGRMAEAAVIGDHGAGG